MDVATPLRSFAARSASFGPRFRKLACWAPSQRRSIATWIREALRVRRCDMPTSFFPSIVSSPGPIPAKQTFRDQVVEMSGPV